jgi:hypothetical protein
LRLLAQKLSPDDSNIIQIRKAERTPMKNAKSTNHPGINRHVHAFLGRRLNSNVGFMILAGFLTAASSAGAEQPDFMTARPESSRVATFSQAQGPLSASADPGQVTMSQIISELNQRQFQLSVAGAQASAERSVFVPRTFTASHAK